MVLAFILSQRELLLRILENLESVTLPGGFAARIQRQVNKEVQEILKVDPKAPERPTERQLQAVSGWSKSPLIETSGLSVTKSKCSRVSMSGSV